MVVLGYFVIVLVGSSNVVAKFPSKKKNTSKQSSQDSIEREREKQNIV